MSPPVQALRLTPMISEMKSFFMISPVVSPLHTQLLVPRLARLMAS
jgi:hypothetical protein